MRMLKWNNFIVTSFMIMMFFLVGFGSIAQITNINGVINNYVKIVGLSSNNCKDTLYVNSTAGFNVNDTVLLIQMKGAIIDSSNTVSFGSILNYNNAGNYEFASIKIIGVNFIVLKSYLTRSYNADGALQLVRIPQYNNVNISGVLTADPWNGNVGGVLAFFSSGTVTFNSNIDLSDKGLRGGVAPTGSFNCNASAYYYAVGSPNGGLKGEGVAEIGTSKRLGRGALANGGGGGNNNNAGGGGGGNFSFGGRGGDQVLYSSCLGIPIGGEAGKGLPVIQTQNKLFLGGGGGSGHQNDNNNQGIHGKNGGGIVFISADNIIGNNFIIKANGSDNTQMPTTDGAGGGGSGGTVVFDVATLTGSLNIEIKGGKGGSINSALYCLGVGGGGSGGVLYHKGSAVLPGLNVNLNGGLAGVEINPGSSCYQSNWGGANGQNGIILDAYQHTFPEVVFANAGPDAMICSGSSIQLGALPLPGLTYSWNNGAGSTANPSVAPLTTTTYILTVSNSGICPVTDTDTVTVIVMPQPQAAFTYSVDCSGLLVSFNNTSIGNSTSIWNFGDGTNSVLASPTHLYPDTGFYNIQLIVSTAGGCTDTIIQSVHLDLPLYPTASFTSDTTACSLNVVFDNSSNFTTGTLWNFGDGNSSTQTNPVHNYLSPGTYQVTLFISNLCGSDTAAISLTIDPVVMPVASFVVDTAFCSASVDFINTSAAAVSWQWDFGAGATSNLANPVHVYPAPGNYTIQLVAVNGCGTDTLSQQLLLDNFNPPVASFTLAFTPCDSTVIFTNTSLNSVSAFWAFGDGDTSSLENPVHNYAGPGTYNVMLIATNECGSDTVTIPTDLSILAPPVAVFTHEIYPCSAEVKFENASINDFEWLWIFGDANFSNDENPLHEYENPGVYEVLLIVNAGSGCQDSASVTIYIDDTGINGLFVPNVFTPNNDGKNDKFQIFSATQCELFNLTIFNRWGQEIFKTGNIAESWDGKYNGTKAPDGVYFYILKGKKKSRHGTVSLFR